MKPLVGGRSSTDKGDIYATGPYVRLPHLVNDIRA